jgi:hypothetical protein
VATGVTETSYLAQSLTLGVTYEWTVESRNSIGYSLVSDSLQIFHALAPEQPSTPTTVQDGDDITIYWLAPTDNGSTISSYSI